MEPARDEIEPLRDPLPMMPNSFVVQSGNEESSSSNAPMVMVRPQQVAPSMNAPPQVTMRQNASPAHSFAKKPSTLPAPSSLIRNSNVPKTEMGLAGVGNVKVQPKNPTHDPRQAALESVEFCSTCKKVVVGGITTKSNNMVQNFCGIACLPRSNAAPSGKQCFTCKKGIVGKGRASMRQNVVYHFCDDSCLPRVRPAPKIAKFYCEICSRSYTAKYSLKRHFSTEHPGQIFNDSIVAIVK